MTGQAIAPASETAARARENSEYVRSLLRVRQPQFAVALESAVQKLLRDHGMVCASSQRTDRSTVTGSAAGVITRRTLPAPADVTVYELTGSGRAPQPALHELMDWGLRYAPEPSGTTRPSPAGDCWAPRAGRTRCPPGGPASCGSDRRSSTSAPTPARSPSAAGPHPMATRWSPCPPAPSPAS